MEKYPLRPALEAVELPATRPHRLMPLHDLRHTAATLWLPSGLHFIRRWLVVSAVLTSANVARLTWRLSGWISDDNPETLRPAGRPPAIFIDAAVRGLPANIGVYSCAFGDMLTLVQGLEGVCGRW